MTNLEVTQVMEFLCRAQLQAVEGVPTEPCCRAGSVCSSLGMVLVLVGLPRRGGDLATSPGNPWACWRGGGDSDS